MDKLIKLGLSSEISGSRTWRIVRIAVLPSLQRKGLGSYMLKLVEEEATKNGVDAVTAIFSGFGTNRFWLKNSYTPIYISPGFNRITGEKNIAVIKGITDKWKTLEELLGKSLYNIVKYGGHILYRDLLTENLSLIVQFLVHRGFIGELPDRYVCSRLSAYIEKKPGMYHESLLDIFVKYFDILIREISSEDFSNEEVMAFVARFVQGKSLLDIVRILGKNVKEVENMFETLAGKLALKLFHKICFSIY